MTQAAVIVPGTCPIVSVGAHAASCRTGAWSGREDGVAPAERIVDRMIVAMMLNDAGLHVARIAALRD